jgi:hypothetical protein
MLDHYGPGVDSDSNRNEYQEYFLGDKGGRCAGLTTLPPSRADCLEIWETQLLGSLRACPVYRDCLTFTFNVRLQTIKDQIVPGMRSNRALYYTWDDERC